jgi:uncharacterized protein YcaQ
MIEVYTPSHKRSFGYFTLPILHRGALVGRLDPKAHRSLGQFEIKAIALEPGVEPTDDLVEGLRTALRRLANWRLLVVIRRASAGWWSDSSGEQELSPFLKEGLGEVPVTTRQILT